MLTELLGLGVNALSGTYNPDFWLINWFRGGDESSSGEYINEENAITVPAVKAAVSILSESIRMLPIEIYRVTKGGTHEPAPDHPVQSILDLIANPDTDSASWKDTEQTTLGLWGNAYSFIQRTGRRDPVALYHLPAKPERTSPFRSDKDGRIWYKLRDEHGQEEDPVSASEILHLKGLSLDGMAGKSLVKLLKETIGGAKAAQRFANERFKNDGAQSGHYTHPGKMTEAAYKRLKGSLDSASSHGNRHKKQILEEGMTFNATGDDPAKMQMIEVRHFHVEEVACFYRISPHLLQDLTHATLSNITELGKEFVFFTLAPWCSRWTSEINVKLLKPPYRCRFNYDAFLQGDHAARAAYHRTMFSVGVESINEVRHKEGLNPLDDPNADEHFVPLNMVPLSKATDPEWVKGSKPGGANQEPKPGAVAPGDGQSTPGEEPQPKEAMNALPNEALEAAEAVLADMLRRMDRIEVNAVLRAAKNPATFVGTLDKFYAKHVETIRETIDLPARAIAAAGGEAADIAAIINEHVAGKREALLTAAECQPGELFERVSVCVNGWNAI
jgi:HK97 family phage portal protein